MPDDVAQAPSAAEHVAPAVDGAEDPPGIPEHPGDDSLSGGLASLLSLAPKYEPDKHATYLRHLQEAVKDPRNLNIALTGRYGTGKSSVLDEFVARHKPKAIRVAISSLGLPDPGASLTNRIQKELVKQLLYRSSPRELRNSRFSRIVPLPKARAAVEAAGAAAVLGLLLWFFGWLPHVAGTSSEHGVLARAGAWAAFAAVVVMALTAARLLLHGRFISEASAAGTAVKLSERTASFFDEYLDELVYFFDQSRADVVVFEDLDRFEDPGIFEALRELNALLNSTAKRTDKGVPLRFLYAIKDSLFELLGADGPEAGQDSAAAETDRANRTKFFDIVVPVVPFISHRNARELLHAELVSRGVRGVERDLVGLVAQHITDMRLIRNICNEYSVFAERLLGGAKIAPGLTPSGLFALVVYKNFHLKDFEEITRRESDLDVLYGRRRAFVRANVDASERRRRTLGPGQRPVATMRPVAERLGRRLAAVASAVKAGSRNHARGDITYSVDGADYAADAAGTYAFWAAAAEAETLTIRVSGSPYAELASELGRDEIAALFPEARGAFGWDQTDEERRAADLARLSLDIAFLRGADFADLAADSRFTPDGDGEGPTFAEIIDETVKSQLAADLVKHGHLDRNFSLYAAQFYGDFTGVDVANFIIHSVETNTMDLDYRFTTAGAVDNLLREAPAEFTRSVSAFNIEVVDHLLSTGDERVNEIADHLLTSPGDDGSTFLVAYFNSGAHPDRLAALLSARPWRNVFAYLATADDLPDDARPALLDAALLHAQVGADYDLGTPVRDYLIDQCLEMTAFTQPQPEPQVDTTASLLKRAGVRLPDLAGVAAPLLDRIVEDRLYDLNPSTLRTALGAEADISLDRIRQNPRVYEYCRDNPGRYLAAASQDPLTPHTALTAETLAAVLADVADVWAPDDVHGLIAHASQQSRLERLADVPPAAWGPLVAAGHVRATFANADAYRRETGSIDGALAALLIHAGRLEADDGDTQAARADLAIDILNASDKIADPETRVELARSLELADYLAAASVTATADRLFALLLEGRLVADTAETFEHFCAAGWPAVEPAIAASRRFLDIVSPELLDGHVAELLRSGAVPRIVQDHVADRLDAYLPNDDKDALGAAAQYALLTERPLPAAQAARVAAATQDAGLSLKLLLLAPDPSAADIVRVLGELPSPYCNFASRAQEQFEVPGDDNHRAVFEVLKRAGVLASFRKKRRPSSKYVARLAA